MRLKLIMMIALTCCASARSHAASVRFGSDMLIKPTLGDARLARHDTADALRAVINVTPRRDSHEMTVTAWLRFTVPVPTWQVPMFTYSPDRIERDNPDLLSGTAGYPASGEWRTAPGTNLTALGGSVTADPFAWQPYEAGSTLSNLWPRGVYTCEGWASNAVTVTVGGNSVTLGPGTFNRNILPGVASSVSVGGSGLACVGLSRCPGTQLFNSLISSISVQAELSNVYISNAFAFVSARVLLTDDLNVCRVDQFETAGVLTAYKATTNAMPETARILSASGIYRLETVFSAAVTNAIDFFDGRQFDRWLSDAELDRIRGNGLDEITRRGIPLIR